MKRGHNIAKFSPELSPGVQQINTSSVSPISASPFFIDLHCHSTASDGQLTPAALVRRAHQRGIRVLALTDHDTTRGIGEARQMAGQLGVHLVNGIELSCTWSATTIHVLGYDFALDAPALSALVERLQAGRWRRAEKIDQRLAAKGMSGCLDGARAVQAELGENEQPPARPHFAEYLVRAGYARDHSEAFNKWLGAGKIGDVKQYWPEFSEVMQVLRDSGARSSLAHPYHYNFTRSKRRRLVRDFAEQGGHALEVSNGLQPPEQVGALSVMAREFGLQITAGSDFHAPRNWSELGLYRAPADDLTPLWHQFNIPAAMLEPETGAI